jgi:hypothetical protein
MILELALSYTPPGSDLSVTLAIVQDVTLLAAALKIAIAEAEAGALGTSNPVSAKAFRTKAVYLHSCLEHVSRSEGGDCESPGKRKVIM